MYIMFCRNEFRKTQSHHHGLTHSPHIWRTIISNRTRLKFCDCTNCDARRADHVSALFTITHRNSSVLHLAMHSGKFTPRSSAEAERSGVVSTTRQGISLEIVTTYFRRRCKYFYCSLHVAMQSGLYLPL